VPPTRPPTSAACRWAKAAPDEENSGEAPDFHRPLPLQFSALASLSILAADAPRWDGPLAEAAAVIRDADGAAALGRVRASAKPCCPPQRRRTAVDATRALLRRGHVLSLIVPCSLCLESQERHLDRWVVAALQ
jgi:hypothetical protein